MIYSNNPGQPAETLRRKVARYLDDRGIPYTLSEREDASGLSRLSSREPRLELTLTGSDVLISMWDVLGRDGSRRVTFWTMTSHGGRDVAPFAQGRGCATGENALALELEDLVTDSLGRA